MIRKLMVPVFAAMALVLLMSAAAFAADVPSVSPYGAGQGIYFVDADGDGVCDNTGLYWASRLAPAARSALQDRVATAVAWAPTVTVCVTTCTRSRSQATGRAGRTAPAPAAP